MPFSKTIKDEVKRKAHFTCCWCRDPRNTVEVHHIIPQAQGGPDRFDNAAPLCPSCHRLVGSNPDLRKEVRSRRDQWYEICAARGDDDYDSELARLELEKAYLKASGKDITKITRQIIDRKRILREVAPVKGDVLGARYQLEEKIGEGGFGVVWKAFDRRTKMIVAVKVLHGQYAKDRTRRERFFRGAREMALLEHEGIVKVNEPKSPGGGPPYFAMEYVGGGDLRQAVLSGHLSVDERLAIVRQVGEALAYAHGEGVIHRDVKPANVLLDLDGRARLTDFDLVKAGDSTGGTRTGVSLGTVVYASPEAMCDASKAGETTDVYGLGMTAIFALHGEDLPLDVLKDAPRFLAEVEAAAPWRAVIAKAVAWEANERWSSIEEFCQALESPPGLELRPLPLEDKLWAAKAPAPLAPADLEIHVTFREERNAFALDYTLHSPRFELSHVRIPGRPLRQPDAWQERIFKTLEKLHRGLDSRAQFAPEDVADDLEILGEELADELFPTELLRTLEEVQEAETVLLVSGDSWIPWEIVKPYERVSEDDDGFLASHFQLSRWISGGRTPAPVVDVARLAVVEAGSPPDLPPLTKAADELQLLRDLAKRHGVEDGSLTGPSHREVLDHLRQHDFGLIHFVGHGEHDTNDPQTSGLHLHDGRCLRPQDLRRDLQRHLWKSRPLVFLNACQAGRQGWAMTRPGGWARRIVLDSGCGAFVAPQWTVGDEVALTFATAFYEALERGATLGQATLSARGALPRGSPGRLAYAVYAHPNGRISFPGDSGRRQPAVGSTNDSG